MLCLSPIVSFLLTVSRHVVQKLDAHANRVVSPSLFSPKKKKQSHSDSRLSSDTPPKDDDDFDDEDDLLALESLLLLLSRKSI